MSEPYIGEIRIFATAWAPYGWFPCTGTLYPVQQYQTLFAVIGRTYGGNGQTTFAVPNFNAHSLNFIPVGTGDGAPEGVEYYLNDMVGGDEVTLTLSSMPTHNHSVQGLASAMANTVASPANAQFSRYMPPPANKVYSDVGVDSLMSPKALTTYGAGHAHENRQPNMVMNYFIAWDGIFPMWD